jgi:hypothetical protein
MIHTAKFGGIDRLRRRPRFVANPNVFVGALDAFTSDLAVVWSVRRLLSSYTGALIRVRRSSDNTEQDIGFTSSGALDTTALLAFCGSGSGFIRWVYDQKTGTAINIGQSTAATQPRIVNAGALETAGMRFLGSQCLDTASLLFSNFAGETDVQLASVMTCDDLLNRRFFEFSPQVIASWLPFSGLIYWDSPVTSGRISFSAPAGFEGVQRSLSFERALTSSRVRIDGTIGGSGTNGGTMSGTSVFTVGASVGGGNAWLGAIRDFVIWKNATNASARVAALSA